MYVIKWGTQYKQELQLTNPKQQKKAQIKKIKEKEEKSNKIINN